MSKRTSIGLVLFVAVVISLGYLGSVRADKTETGKDETAYGPALAENTQEIKGKFLAITLATQPAEILLIESPRVTKLADQAFVVGKSLGGTGAAGWNKGAVAWTPLKEVAQLAEFENLDTLRNLIRLD